MTMLRSLWGWLSGSRIGLFFGALSAVLIGLFVAHRKGVSAGRDAEKMKAKAASRDAIIATIQAKNDAASARNAAQILADHEHTRIAADLEKKLANPKPTALDLRDIDRQIEELERGLKDRKKN